MQIPSEIFVISVASLFFPTAIDSTISTVIFNCLNSFQRAVVSEFRIFALFWIIFNARMLNFVRGKQQKKNIRVTAKGGTCAFVSLGSTWHSLAAMAAHSHSPIAFNVTLNVCYMQRLSCALERAICVMFRPQFLSLSFSVGVCCSLVFSTKWIR